MSDPLLAILKKSLTNTADVYVNERVDAERYFVDLASDIWSHRCSPFPLSATVMAPGFPDAVEGSVISGQCVAHHEGYWLVYQPQQDRFLCFWGADKNNLGAHGVLGSPLYCWSA
jgi:hypothetical protein